jgi:hypothetical protein
MAITELACIHIQRPCICKQAMHKGAAQEGCCPQDKERRCDLIAHQRDGQDHCDKSRGQNKGQDPCGFEDRYGRDDGQGQQAPQIAFAAVSAQSFLDPEAIIIDSSLTPELTARIVDAVGASIEANYDHRGLAAINFVPGETGISARAIGSSIAPFLSEFALDRT